MENVIGIGYVLSCPSRGTFLGKLGTWYTDVRLAQVYAEPRSAKMAAARAEVSFPVAVVPVKMEVRGIDLEQALADAKVYEVKQASAAQQQAKPAQRPEPKPKPEKAA